MRVARLQSRCISGLALSRLVILCSLLTNVCCGGAASRRSLKSSTQKEDVAPEGRFPYMCKVRNETESQICGGTLIKQRWVLTSARCVDPNVGGSAGLSPTIYCYVHDREETPVEKRFLTDEIFIHGDWHGDRFSGNDLALIKLNRNASFATPDINISEDKFDPGDVLAVVGWGENKRGTRHDQLKIRPSLSIVPLLTCNRSAFWDGIITESMICAWSPRQSSSKGDSGGPLLVLDRFRGTTKLGNPFSDLLVGIVSFGPEIANSSLPNVYTNITFFSEWIECITEEKGGCLARKTDPDSVPPTDEPAEAPSLSDEPFNLCLESNSESEFSKGDAIKRMRTALETDSEDVAENLLCVVLQPNVSFGPNMISLLILAAKYNAPNSAKVFLHYGTNVEYKDANEESALTVAVRYGSATVALVLIENDADIESRSLREYTPLCHAVWNENNEMVQILLRNDADVNARTDVLSTPLHLAAQEDNTNIAQILIDAGADIEAKNEDGDTPLHIAAYWGSGSLSHLLIQKGASITVQNIEGSTPLHVAASRGHFPTATILLNGGAPLSIANNNGEIPFDVICKNEFLSEPCSPGTDIQLENVLRP